MRGFGRWGRVAAVLVAVLVGTAAAQVKRVAVVETEIDAQSGASKTVNKAEVRQITAVLRKEAVKKLPQGKYEIMTSETVMAQGSAKLEECADENCVITLGSMIGADYIVRGTISKVGTKLTTSVDIFETENGNLVASSDLVRAGNIEELLDKTAAACAEMYKTFESGLSNARKAVAAQPTYQPPAQTYQPQTPAPTPAPSPAVAVQQPVYQAPPPPSPPPPPKQVYQAPPPPPPPPPPTTLSIKYGSLRDNRDGKTYKTVVIGGKTWMAENLNYKKGKSWCYDKNDSNCDTYGRLYDWKTARTVCPAGFHLPSRQEWDNLVTVAGGKEVAGKKLKARSGWSNNGNGTDEYGFSAFGGYRNPTSGRHFGNADDIGRWWMATEYESDKAYYRSMFYYNDKVYEGSSTQDYGYSVRCIADN